MLQQPYLFIRYRKKPEQLRKLLQAKNIPFTQINESCFSLPNATKLQDFLPEKDYVIQDASSQKTGEFFAPQKGESWWDCCAGAGGKSLLLKDLQPSLSLTVSDRRATILHNLKERFHLYFNDAPKMLVLDMTDENQLNKQLNKQQFDCIICDVPCSGSGTWARTPEQLYFFEETKLADFHTMQKTIATHALQFLKPNGKLIYLTCSVLKNENEAVVADLVANADLVLEQQQLINGIAIKADSMFAAVLRKK
jgi:16S rRNA (cytosine967-C5)-methyltransferase